MNHNTSRRNHISNQKGSILLTFAVSIVGLFCFAVVAIDGAILMTTKNQLQCAADAAALAGASAYNLGDDAVRHRAEYFAENNYAVQDTMRACLIDPDVDVVINRDVNDPWVQVTTHRTNASNDPLRTYFLKILDLAAGQAPNRPNRVDVTARAKAELVDNCGARCLKPWAIPDRWEDINGNGIYDQGVDIYDPVVTGYQAPRDVGVSVVLKQGDPHDTVAPGQFYPIDYPPVNRGNPITGGSQYRDWIAGCCPYLIVPGDTLLLEPGNKVGPTKQGVQDLISQDPTAYWDGTKVAGSSKANSPRIALVPFYDPNYPPNSGRNNVIVAKIGAFFIEGVSGNGSVIGRFIQVSAPGEPCAINTGQSLVLGLHLIE